ncbi:MAG TPA: PaaX family transcriptional regulator C-terminal domain-containing protein, partial [Gemmatimonadota bacterium]|nr:PaaX family transcriptional regulator C-terminal domain-containing protein [Gemmatimonadota bacterium]
LLHRPGPVWVGSLLALLEPLGFSEGAARTALSRMGSHGWLASERRGRNAFYSLTRKGRALLEEGEARIYRPAWDEPWDGSWSLVHYSIPEEDRSLRDRLRLRLSWLGCGSLGNGLWITPHDVAGAVRELAATLDIEGGLEVFRQARPTFAEAGELVERCWELERVHERYLAFIDRHLPRLRSRRAELERGELRPEAAFVHRIELVDEYREFPFEDPYLPRRLLPDDWAGDCAAGLFRHLHDLLEAPAEAFVDQVLARADRETDSTVTVP